MTDGALIAFEGTHTHALTNTLFGYTVRCLDHGDIVDWTATLRLGAQMVDELHGSAPRLGMPPGTEPTTLVMHQLNRLIDAKDYGQRSNVAA